MEGYYMESPSDHKRTISLNLADLKSDTENIHNPNLRRGLYSDITPALAHPDEFLKKSIRDITKQESSYQQNFSVLLSKSKGTKYEPVLRKLMNMECVEVIYSPHKSAKLASEPSHLKAGVPPTKQVIQTLAPKRSIYEQQQTSKFLAQPVARKIWKGSPSKNCVTTNCKGRQRPPPKDSYTCDLAEDWNYQPPATSRSGAGGGNSVSIRDFHEWLDNNKAWKQKLQEKVNAMETKRKQEELSQLTQPKITARSVKLADIARRKHDEQLAALPAGKNHPHAPRDNDDDNASVSSKSTVDETHGKREGRSRHELRFSFGEEKVNTRSRDDDSAASWGGSTTVYDRLYSDYKKYEHRNLAWEPPQLPFSFSPSMCEKSRHLLEQRKEKIVSIINRRSSDVDIVTSLGLSENPRRHRSMSPADRRAYAEQRHQLRMRMASPTTSAGGKIYHQDNLSLGQKHQQRSTGTISSRGTSTPVKVNDMLAEARARSRARAEAINHHRTQRAIETTQTLPDGRKMFQPVVDNSETKKILESRITETFEDRLFRSVDNYTVRQKLARQPKPTPGPGQYSNILDSNQYSQSPCRSRPSTVSPGPGSNAVSSIRSPSPGRNGFSFGKQARGVLFDTPKI